MQITKMLAPIRPKILKSVLISLIVGSFVTGCTTPSKSKWFAENGKNAVLGEVMKRRDKIIQLSSEETAGNKPVLVLLHGATDDPTEMMDIVSEWSGTYDVFLYVYNFHKPVEKVAADFAGEMKRIESENRLCDHATVVVYSYSAIVFREAVISANDRSLFSGVSLIQLVPTAGGSHLARGMRYPFIAWIVSLVSKSSRAENPYGRFAEQIWDGDGNRKFYEVIKPDRMHTILLDDDTHSLAHVSDKMVQERYDNGIGTNVVVIPQSAGVTHDYFPTNQVALGYMRKLLEQPQAGVARSKI